MTRAAQMALGLFVLGHGHNVGSWRAPGAEADDLLNLDYYTRIAQAVERAKFDMIFFAEILYSYEQNGRHCGQMAYPTLDPLVLIGALGSVTSHIGLTGTYSTTYTDPFVTAAKLVTADRLNGGRTGWNVVTTAVDDAARNFSLRHHPDKNARYARALDYVDHVCALWQTVPPTRQGTPVLVQAGMSPAGRDFAASIAEVMFTVAKDINQSRAFREDLHGLLRTHGRDPGNVRVMPGIAPILGATEAEAKEKEDLFFELVHPKIQLALLSDQYGMDFSRYDLAQPLPQDILNSPRVLSGARDPARLIAEVEGRTPTLHEYLRQSARVRSHMSFVGTPERLADQMQAWFEGGACDGFNIMPPVIPGGLEVLTEELVPILRRRGLFRTEYAGTTLRQNLGIAQRIARTSAGR
jgi:alkanesulfonate monooxygenase SsuD/methylene tetrahydromethanopterin reductase-like flavin-dependent oxidoreductase (luciferase family)